MRALTLLAQSAWRDFIRGHTVGQGRDLGFVGRVAFLLVIRWAMWIFALFRIFFDSRHSAAVVWAFGLMSVLAVLAIPITFQHRKRDYDYWQLLFVALDSLIITYLVWWAGAPQSDIFLLYSLPLLTAAEHVGGWSVLLTFVGISAMYGIAVLSASPNAPRGVIVVIYATREVSLAFLAALALSLFQITGRALGDVHQALRKLNTGTSEWVRLDADLDALLREVLGLGFEFAALSTVDPYQREIVMSRSVNIPAGWVRRSRRPIDDPTEIMADVLRTGLVETPRHDDSRFEQSTYRLFRHDQLARVYVPLHYGLDKPVAVVQAGWERQRKGDVIPRELADRLDCLAGQKRELIARSAPHMFLEELCRIVLSALQGCDAVTLHLYQDGQVLWVARAGACSDQYVIQLQGILGLPRVAAAKRNPEWIDEAEKVRAEYPALHDGGWRSVALVPLETGPQTIGVLTVLFEHEQRFGKWLLEQILLLGRAVESAIQTRLLLIESAQRSSRAWMQSRLKTVEDALEANAPLKEVLQRVAEHFLYNLEADCVTLYEYDGRDFRSPPNFAGEFRDQGAMAGTIMLGNLLWQCLERSSQFYRDLPTEFLANRQDGSTAERFAVREGIKSCAVLVLETEDHGERAGLIFVNYRRIVGFSPEVRVAMAMLAASASVAIRTARQIERRRLAVESMQQIDRAITMSAGPPDLDSILRQVLGSACSLTGAWRGRILWFAPNRRNLEWRVAHGCPVPAERIVGLDELPVVRQVLAQKRFIAVPGDVPEDARLAVPLGDSGDILGIVVLEGTQRQRFSSEDALTVEMLGVLAVAGARFTDLQRPLVSLSAVAARLQEQPFDLDTALRVILTGVTAGEGLGFTRAMVFLREGKTDGAKGRLATGPLTGSEAEKSWEDFENLERQSRPPDVARFTWLLDRAEESSRKIREGGADSVLSRHVQALWLPASLWETRRPEYESAVSSQ